MTNLNYHYNYIGKAIIISKFSLGNIKAIVRCKSIKINLKNLSINSIWFFFILFSVKPKVIKSNLTKILRGSYRIKSNTLIFYFLEKIKLFILPNCPSIEEAKQDKSNTYLIFKNFLSIDIGIDFLNFKDFLIEDMELNLVFSKKNLQNKFFIEFLRFKC